jgi:hypothetical protein
MVAMIPCPTLAVEDYVSYPIQESFAIARFHLNGGASRSVENSYRSQIDYKTRSYHKHKVAVEFHRYFEKYKNSEEVTSSSSSLRPSSLLPSSWSCA